MPPFRIQAALEEHAAVIQRLVVASSINPTGLDWQRFLLAVDETGKLIGCGQIKPHSDGSQELASIAVEPAWRGRGIARALIERLIAQADGPLYLMCQSSLGPLYEKFGFTRLAEDEMPKYFRRISKLAGVLEAVRAKGELLLIMRREKKRRLRQGR
jgi:N-acetylglutamate synthase-like GNAT family acetyltransferase